MPSLTVADADIPSFHATKSRDSPNKSVSGQIFEPPSIMVPIWDLIVTASNFQKQFCDIGAMRCTSPPIDMVQSSGDPDTT